jgi:hypothetical protein
MGERAVVGLGVVLLLLSGAQGHAVMRNPHPRSRLRIPEVATFSGLPDDAALQGCGNTNADEPTATYRPGQLINVTYEVIEGLEHPPAPGVRVALRFPGGDFEPLTDENGFYFNNRRTLSGESLTSSGLHTVDVRLPADVGGDVRTCEGPAVQDLCQLQWVISSEGAHDNAGGYSIGCADVQISTTAHVDHGYGPAPTPPASGSLYPQFVQAGGQGTCIEQDTQTACEFLSDSMPVYKRCTWMEQVGRDGECVDAGFEWTSFNIMCAVAGGLIVIALLFGFHKNHQALQDKNLKAIETAEHLDYRCGLWPPLPIDCHRFCLSGQFLYC